MRRRAVLSRNRSCFLLDAGWPLGAPGERRDRIYIYLGPFLLHVRLGGTR